LGICSLLGEYRPETPFFFIPEGKSLNIKVRAPALIDPNPRTAFKTLLRSRQWAALRLGFAFAPGGFFHERGKKYQHRGYLLTRCSLQTTTETFDHWLKR
jgi:hypothetical protein